MAGPAGTGSGETPSLFASIRSFWSVLLAIFYTRLDLASTELEDQALRGVKLVVTGLLAILCLFVAYFFAMFFIIALAWDTPYRFVVIALIFAVYLLFGLTALFVARDMIINRPKFMSQTIAELRRDVEGLIRTAATAAKDEAKP